jgi:hypothetical protein
MLTKALIAKLAMILESRFQVALASTFDHVSVHEVSERFATKHLVPCTPVIARDAVRHLETLLEADNERSDFV